MKRYLNKTCVIFKWTSKHETSNDVLDGATATSHVCKAGPVDYKKNQYEETRKFPVKNDGIVASSEHLQL
jgi:hypothetical protein